VSATFLIALNVVINLLILLLPIALVGFAFMSWMSYRRTKFQYETDWRLIELILPPEVYKSPQAMEILFTSLYQKNDGTKTEVYLDGSQRPTFALEMISEAGAIRFFIWLSKAKYIPITVNSLYSQFPGLEIVELDPNDDYAKKITWNPDKRFIWGTYWKLKKTKEPIPIVSYKKYELDKNPDEELKIDPFVSVVEYLGGLGYGESAYLQFTIRGNTEDDWTSGNVFPFMKKPGQKEKIDDFIKKLKEDSTTTRASTGEQDKDGFSMINYEPGVTDQIKDLRNLQDKVFFETIIRGMYVTKNETFNNGNITGLIGTMQFYGHAGGNDFKLATYTDLSDDHKDWLRMFPFKFLNNMGLEKRKNMEKSFLKAYKRRGGFYPPDKGNLESTTPMVFSSEELATMFHLPGTAAASPSLGRVDARKADPPSNLPV